eukprot:snap_masked-scaffold_2-processed-gene-13.21-mRNA-1 protein AED:1.00 eAED:1.00 QI:0/-1/0/0/-1/1/1/0/74
MDGICLTLGQDSVNEEIYSTKNYSDLKILYRIFSKVCSAQWSSLISLDIYLPKLTDDDNMKICGMLFYCRKYKK